jgi:mannose-1-phosphate guanylyltransferase
MQALILAGGEGTRLRPLTLTRPKPALQLVDRPFLRYMVDWVARHGIDEVVVASGFGAGVLREALGDGGAGPRIAYVEEPEPLGTAGPLRLAADQGLLEERFLVLNGDILSDLDLGALMAAHDSSGASATLALYPVADPAAYGLVRRAGGPRSAEGGPAAATGEVLGFLEKPDPAEIDTNEISAGAYVIEQRVLDLIPGGRMVSIEREVFPRLVGDGLYGHVLNGYWMDIGTPERYLTATWDILERRVETGAGARVDAAGLLVEDGATVATDASIRAPALVEGDTQIDAQATIGPRALIAHGAGIGARATVSSSVLLAGARVGAAATITESILAPGVQVGHGARIGPGAVIGENARIEPGAELGHGERLAPGELVR